MEIEIADVMKRIGNSVKRNKQKEATTFAVASFCLWEYKDSNLGPSACKADALNQLSYTPSQS